MKYDSQIQTSSRLNIPIGEIQRAKRQGSDAFKSGRIDGDKLKAWLKANPKPKTITRTTPQTTPAERGAGMALARLEAEEASLHAKLVAAVAAGEPEATAKARAEWLRTSRELLRYDSAVESSRRGGAAMVSISEVETKLRHMGWLLSLAGQQVAERLRATAALSEDQYHACNRYMRQNLGESLEGLAAGKWPAELKPFPFMIEAMVKGFKQ